MNENISEDMKNKVPEVAFIIAAGKKHGIGHVKRCSIIAERGKRYFNSYFCIPGYEGYSDIKKIVKFPIINISDIETRSKIGKVYDLFVTDCRDTGRRFTRDLARLAPVISIDDLGRGTMHAVMRIISLPSLKKVDSNYEGLRYLILDPTIEEIRERIDRSDSNKREGILISFGGSDPHNLTIEIAQIVAKAMLKAKVIKGPLFNDSVQNYLKELNVDIVEDPENLYDLIARSELLITSFGITMFEAIYLKTPVVLYNHSKYHYKLSLRYDLPNLAYPGYFKKYDLERILLESIKNKEKLAYDIDRYKRLLDTRASDRIISIIKNTIDNGRKDCLFHHKNYKVIFRQDGYSILKCLKCGDLFLTGSENDKPGSKNRYKKDYFLDEYRRQYGRSYEEDKRNIVASGNARLDRIERLKPDRGRLLDVGCALGFFVELAVRRGWKGEGIEISEYASGWARNNLGIKVITGSFLNHNFKDEYFDAITMFYVLEHFVEVEKVIEKAYKILKQNGVLAIAMPNRGGISYRMNRKEFLINHPDDHYFDTTIRNISKFLLRNGFKVRDLRVTGIHPERFFLKIGIKKSPRFLNRIYYFTAKAFHLGDTFEIYAVKK